MGTLKGYQISLVGLANGLHSFTFSIGDDFFEHFENSSLKGNRFEVRIDMDKHQNMFILKFEIKGSIRTSCDRCMADIIMPLQGEHQLIVKSAEGVSDDPDVEHIAPEAPIIEVGQMIYEFILISLPMVNVYDCEKESPRPCDEAALATLENSSKVADSGIWDALKNLEVEK